MKTYFSSIIEDDYVRYQLRGEPDEYIPRYGICPLCRGKVEFNGEYYVCPEDGWYDINVSTTFYCDWCGEVEIEGEETIIENGDKLCRDCVKQYREENHADSEG